MATKQNKQKAENASEENPNWLELSAAFNETAAVLQGINSLLLLNVQVINDPEKALELGPEKIAAKRKLIEEANGIVKTQISEMNMIKVQLKGDQPVTANDYQEYFNLSLRLMNVSGALGAIDVDKLNA